MDEIVRQAMNKWPNVPDVYHWLQLDQRGCWRIRSSDRLDIFSPITNPGVISFINRNYLSDKQGRWFFQNGPQRVFVDIAYTPWIVHAGYDQQKTLIWYTHTQHPVKEVISVLVDENSTPILETKQGVARISDHSLVDFLQILRDAKGNPASSEQQENWCYDPWGSSPLYCYTMNQLYPILPIAKNDIQTRYGFITYPMPPEGQADCS